MAINIQVLTTLTMLLGWPTLTTTTTIMKSSTTPANVDSYIEEACKVTTYPDLCVKSLASFSDKARTSPSRWARAGVSVAIGSAKDVSTFLVGLKFHGSMTGRSVIQPLEDCLDTLHDALYNLHRSLNVLRNLNLGDFEFQMSDLLTSLSAALTDETTCIDGLEGIRGNTRQVVLVVLQNKVVNASYMTSNALALANWLASRGIDQSQLLGDPYNKKCQGGA